MDSPESKLISPALTLEAQLKADGKPTAEPRPTTRMAAAKAKLCLDLKSAQAAKNIITSIRQWGPTDQEQYDIAIREGRQQEAEAFRAAVEKNFQAWEKRQRKPR